MAKASVRCAIYTRKSSEEGLEQEFNSLDAQREACEAFISSQRRYALRRHSSRKAGSIFLAEIQRTTSSFKPGGAVSASISVTQPYLYSWSAADRSSLFVTSVLVAKSDPFRDVGGTLCPFSQ